MKNKNMTIEERFEDARKIFKILGRLMGFGGIWPLTKSNFYLTWVIAYIINVFFGILFFVGHHDTLPLVANNISEVLLNVTVTSKILILRFSDGIRKVLMTVHNNMQSNHFDTDEEREIYLEYALKGKNMGKFITNFIIGAAAGFYLRPLGVIAVTSLINSSNIIYELPYPKEVFLDCTEIKIYILIYLCELPHAIMNSYFGTCLALDYVIGFHCCGELAVLKYRIKRIGTNKGIPAINSASTAYKELIEYHFQIIKLVKDVDAALRISLLEEVLAMMGILALTSYTIMLNATDLAIIVSYGIFCAAALCILYTHCLISENLVLTSTDVNEAYYDSEWYTLIPSDQRLLTICIAGSSKPLYLTGGGFYVYSMASYASVLKSAMAYLSMLRSVS